MTTNLSRAVAKVWAWLFLLLLVVVVTLFAVAAGDESPELAILAGVLVGSTVTGVVTWILGPKVEQRVRQDARREQALSDILTLLLNHAYRDAQSASVELIDNTKQARKATRRLTEVAERVRLLAVATHDAVFLSECEQWRRTVYRAHVATLALPTREPERDYRMVGVPLGGIYAERQEASSAADPEAQARTSMDELEVQTHLLATHVIVLLGAPIPEFLRPHRVVHELSPLDQEIARVFVPDFINQLSRNVEMSRRTAVAVIERMANGDLDLALATGRRWGAIARELLGTSVSDDSDDYAIVGALLLRCLADPDLIAQVDAKQSTDQQEFRLLLQNAVQVLRDALRDDV